MWIQFWNVSNQEGKYIHIFLKSNNAEDLQKYISDPIVFTTSGSGEITVCYIDNIKYRIYYNKNINRLIDFHLNKWFIDPKVSEVVFLHKLKKKKIEKPERYIPIDRFIKSDKVIFYQNVDKNNIL